MTQLTMPSLAEAAKLVAQFEGFRAKPYYDSANIPTIAFGCIAYPDGTRVTMQDKPVTETEALAFLEHDLTTTAKGLWKFIERQPSLHQWSALVSLAFNVGVTAVSRSTVLRLFNAGQLLNAASRFIDWDKARIDGQLVEIQGLKNRRIAESQLFLTNDNE